MSDPGENSIKNDEGSPEAAATSSSTSTTKEPFEANAYIANLIGFMRSTEKDANQKFTEFMAKTWSRPSDSANFSTDSYSLDSGGVSKLPQNHMMGAQKSRIAGTQRLMYAPPQQTMNKPFGGLEKLGSGPASAAVAPGVKKVKKQMPVIDDSIYCTTDQPCKTCGGVSLSGNQVLACKRCRDCYHMKCSVPPVSVEEASDPNFNYHCKTCLISRKVLNASRSRSPSPMIDAKKMKLGKLTKP